MQVKVHSNPLLNPNSGLSEDLTMEPALNENPKPSLHSAATAPQGQENGLAGSQGTGQHDEPGKVRHKEESKKPREVFESSGIPLLLRGSSGRRQEPVERAR